MTGTMQSGLAKSSGTETLIHGMFPSTVAQLVWTREGQRPGLGGSVMGKKKVGDKVPKDAEGAPVKGASVSSVVGAGTGASVVGSEMGADDVGGDTGAVVVELETGAVVAVGAATGESVVGSEMGADDVGGDTGAFENGF